MKAIGVDPGLAMTGFGVVELLSREGRHCNARILREENQF